MAFAAGLLGSYTNTSSNMDRFSAAQHGLSRDDGAAAVRGWRGETAGGGQRRGDHDAAAIASGCRLAVRAVRDRADRADDHGEAVRLPDAQSRRRSTDPALLKPYVDAHPQYRALYSLADTLDQWYAFPGPRSEQIAEAITVRMRALLIRRASPEAALAEMVREAQRLIDWR